VSDVVVTWQAIELRTLAETSSQQHDFADERSGYREPRPDGPANGGRP